MMYGIPNMKLDKSIIDMRRDIMEEEGIKFHVNKDVGGSSKDSISMEKLVKENDIVLLTTGATKPRDLPIQNREGAGVYFAMEFLGQNTKSLLDNELKEDDYIDAKGKDVIVIGGGDTGNDCLGTSLRHGCKTLTNFEILPELPSERMDNNPWPLFPRVYKVDYHQLVLVYQMLLLLL